MSTQQHGRPVITHWPGKVHDVAGITGDPRILFLGSLTSFGVVRFVPGWL